MGRKLKGRQVVGKGLKGALQSHKIQEEFKQKKHNSAVNEKQRQAEKLKSIRGGGKPQKPQVNQKPKQAFIPFQANETVLLVGEGDFSYARSIVEQGFVKPENLIATSFDSENQLVEKYSLAAENVEFLRNEGVDVMHEIDATNLLGGFKIKPKKLASVFSPPKKLNHIMFNFPHTGKGIKDQDRNIRDHQKLVLGYFQSAHALFGAVNSYLKPELATYIDDQESSAQKILLSLFNGEPYISWGVKALARNVGYRVERSGAFDWATFKGYQHRRTTSMRDTTKPAAERDARIYVFEEWKETQTLKKKEVESDDE